ncbi:FAD binding domain-containing protein [Candidatus Riflebacteria bacterium]
MAIAHEFDYHKPANLDEALEFLAKYKGNASILAGGTDLIGWIREDFLTPEALIDIKGLSELKRLDFQDDRLFIGSLVTFAELIKSEIITGKFPLLGEAASVVGSCGVRNRATMVGNICSSVPCCDSGSPLLVYEAEVQVKGPEGTRKIPISSWFVGPKKTALKEGEIVLGLEISLPDAKHGSCYVKMGRYRGEDLAQASVAILAFEKSFRVAFAAVGPTPLRAKGIEKHLEGKELSDSSIEEAIKLLPEEISPITDVRATKEYRLHMCGVMLKRGLKAASSRLAGNGPASGTKLI